MSSSSRNIVFPVPQRKGRFSSSSSAAHQLVTLPFHSAHIYKASSISKLDIIDVLSGKSGTKGGALSCSEDTLKTSLLPILCHQADFYKLFGKIDNENAQHFSSSSPTSSLSYIYYWVPSRRVQWQPHLLHYKICNYSQRKEGASSQNCQSPQAFWTSQTKPNLANTFALLKSISSSWGNL